MTIDIKPSKAVGSVEAPPSKSMAHRALICGALTAKSKIQNVSFSEDIKATINCLKSLGATVKIIDNTVEIGGLKLENIPDNAELYCNESGSTLRFLLPLCMVCGKRVALKGTKRLFVRPLDIYECIAKKHNIEFIKREQSVTVCGNLKAGDYRVAGNISSQFISGLLFALPLLNGNSKIEVTGNFESASYIDLTTYCIKYFGIDIKRENNTFYIESQNGYKSCDYIVEADCSNAAFLEAFNYIGGNVKVEGLNRETLQGDRVYKQIFDELKSGKKQFDLSDCPDLAPVAFALAAVYGGAEFTGTKRLKIKESDRAEAMKQELSKFGIEVFVNDNSVIIKKGELKKPTKVLNSHNDHRIAMALTLLSTVTGGVLSGTEAVAKSYPEFYEKICSMGIDLNEIN